LEEEKMFSNHRTGGKLTAVVQQNSHHSSGWAVHENAQLSGTWCRARV
jgi:hypothetical protein